MSRQERMKMATETTTMTTEAKFRIEGCRSQSEAQNAAILAWDLASEGKHPEAMGRGKAVAYKIGGVAFWIYWTKTGHLVVVREDD